MTVITLLSDFGSSSPYPAEMKGVLLTLCRATIVDITHDVPSHGIVQGAYLLAAVAPTFPAGTVHLAVVDPGVGTTRRPLAVASGGQFFVGPDNGLLMPAARAMGVPRAFVIAADRFARRPLAATFHGRDLFAPVAAALASGLPIDDVGAPVSAPVERVWQPPTRASGMLRGQVVYGDSFGNLVTNIPGEWLGDLPGSLVLEHPGGRAAVRRAVTYADGTRGTLVALVGSDGTVEIAVNGGRATDTLSVRVGETVTLLHTGPTSS